VRKLAIFLLFILVAGTVTTTLAATNYGGFGTWLYDSAEGTMFMPIRNSAIDTWFMIGNNGFAYIALATLGIAICGGLFLTVIVYGLIWQKGLGPKLGYKPKSKISTTTREEPQNIIITESPAPTKTVSEPKKEELTVESTA